MSDIAVQASFNSGEWAPSLNARVDLAKYKSGAALLQNFFVDYRGGASTRSGTKYIIQCYNSVDDVRVISFQASFNVGYCLEFGNGYIRFIFDGSPVVETPIAITAATKANPCVITVPGHAYTTADWIYIAGVVGMTQLNGKYYKITNVAGNNLTLAGLNGAAINSTGYGTYVSGGTTARVYTIASPYTSADDLRLIKFAQSINQMILCHPNHTPYVLTLVTATNWTLAPITIGSTATTPSGVTSSTTLGSGAVNYSYIVTSIDSTGQESAPSARTDLQGYQDLRTTAGTIQVQWSPAQSAVGYNVYESNVSYFGILPYGVQYGFIGTCSGTTFIDSNITPNFSETPPVAQNTFQGSGVDVVTVTAAGTYTTVPTVSFPGTSTIPATGLVSLGGQGTPTITAGGAGFVVGDVVQFHGGLTVRVTTVAAGAITGWVVTSVGSVTSGSTPSNPNALVSTSGAGSAATATVTWGVGQVIVLTPGAGYLTAPTPTFSTGAATATCTLAATSNGNPTVPSFFQQRLIFAGPAGAPQTFYLSKPGAYYNFDISSPSQADDSITGTLVSGVLNSIRSIVSSTAGMLILTDKGAWLINGGSSGSAISPSAIVANAQSFIGANDMPPIVANYDVLYVQSKGAGVRDLAYNIYFNAFMGTDISTISSHLFYGYSLLEWAWAEQPFYTAWAVRNDGVMLTLTYLKEQEFIGWSHQVTYGSFISVCAVTENTNDAGNVDAVYTVVERTVGGSAVKYIERVAERIFPNGVADAWCVDSGLQYNGSPATTFSGGEHLAGLTCTGLADGAIIPSFVMPSTGNFTLTTAASKVTVGLGYTCDLQTLALELGEPSVQGKVKKINSVDVRVASTLGLDIGQDFNHLTPMKDLVNGNVSSMLTGQQTQVVNGLVTGDARTFLSPAYTVPGQYCIRQSKPYPASILGVFPTITQGDDR